MAKHPHGTCTLVMCSKSKVFGQEEVPTTVKRECQADEKQLDSREFEAPNRLLKISESEEAVNVTKEEIPLHLRVKRLREVKGIRTTNQDDYNALSRLDLSVLSRYKAMSNANEAAHIKRGSSAHDYSSVLKGDSASTSRDKCSHPCPAFPSLGNKDLFSRQVVILDKPDDMTAKETLAQPRATHQDLQVQNLEHFHHHDHPVQNISQKLSLIYEDCSLKKVGAVPLNGSPNISGSHVDNHTISSGSDGRTST